MTSAGFFPMITYFLYAYMPDFNPDSDFPIVNQFHSILVRAPELTVCIMGLADMGLL